MTSVQSYDKGSFFTVFSRLGKVFGPVEEWLMLELHEMIRVSHVVLF